MQNGQSTRNGIIINFPNRIGRANKLEAVNLKQFNSNKIKNDFLKRLRKVAREIVGGSVGHGVEGGRADAERGTDQSATRKVDLRR